MTTRRQFLASTAAITLMPYAAMAAAHASHSFASDTGEITVHPISHASFVMQTPAGTIYVDPVGDAASYADLPSPDMILITHEHGDHYNAQTLAAIVGADTIMLSNPSVFNMLPDDLKARTTAIANDEDAMLGAVAITAIPAYNTTPDRANFHPKGRDNGYVVTIDGMRIYISGDTEGTPEMRALENIDVAFVCMNLPFTMSAMAAAEAVSEFAPTYVYPYHYRGRDNGTQDPQDFADMLTSATETKMGGWYG